MTPLPFSQILTALPLSITPLSTSMTPYHFCPNFTPIPFFWKVWTFFQFYAYFGHFLHTLVILKKFYPLTLFCDNFDPPYHFRRPPYHFQWPPTIFPNFDPLPLSITPPPTTAMTPLRLCQNFDPLSFLPKFLHFFLQFWTFFTDLSHF